MAREDEPVFRDQFFRRKRRNGEWEVVASPTLFTSVADTHAHLQLLPDPGLALARAALHKVRFIETIVDVWEDGDTTFEKLGEWKREGAIGIRTIARHC
ncbi:nitrate ABC transporter substrate-binding protein [Adlercreutzia faecimuris]|uniref:Nitrate ABC transporter substrate-binding protein n=1 Tax=Adlercreutzia faecimuris TaxID=2897341 RepID=A0ABS9WF01_9ACTN|nr:nitrate ABC transporter substrate-binding protein [Adlercreutzia sp. JBNU-10]MCI2241448.1 nitrate ABC transporter substrate-binding protein [Adlercreutzia sp. JBNU-10]